MNRRSLLFTPAEGGENGTLLAIERADATAHKNRGRGGSAEAGQGLHGADHAEYAVHGCRVSHAALDDGAAYHTLITGKLWLCEESVRARHRRALSHILLHYLRRAGFCRRSGRVLFCGLGNAAITADALGAMVCDRLRAVGDDPLGRAAGMTALYVLKPGVPAQSGIPTGEHIRTVASHLGVDLIITADATSARTVKRLASVVQVTDRGVVAGSGTGGHADEISRRTMPCPVISVGVPTVIRSSVLGGGGEEDFLVSYSETDVIVDCYAELIGGAVNGLFSLAMEEEEPIKEEIQRNG